MTVTALPIRVVDIGGALLMIVFSFLCVLYALRLRKNDTQNIVWTYLMWVCFALALFAVSRSIGHIIRQVLSISGHQELWSQLQPFSGSVNSLTFIAVGAVTLFFERTWTIYQDITRDRQALREAHQELIFLNKNLERLVTERTNALTLSEHRYRRIFEASKDMILSATRDGDVLDLNPAGYALLGLSSQEDISRLHLSNIFPDAATWPSLLDIIDTRGFVPSTEIDLKTADGGRCRAILSGNLATEETGQPDGVIYLLIKDIEQQRQMREQMAQAEKLASVGELSAGIAHEINNPLGIILGYTQLMLRNQKENTDLQNDLRTIEKHTRQCKSIVEDLLNFSRKSAPRKELCDIHHIIDDALCFIQKHSDFPGIQYRKEYDEQMEKLLVDAKKIHQVLINLIMNATHAVGQRGIITIRTRLDGHKSMMIIQISDNGCGIDPKNLTRIFDPFFTTKSTGKGTGLGLSVSYGIIHNHGGDIHVESDIGRGSTFTVELPFSTPNRGK